jgi:hypothetical protein
MSGDRHGILQTWVSCISMSNSWTIFNYHKMTAYWSRLRYLVTIEDTVAAKDVRTTQFVLQYREDFWFTMFVISGSASGQLSTQSVRTLMLHSGPPSVSIWTWGGCLNSVTLATRVLWQYAVSSTYYVWAMQRMWFWSWRMMQMTRGLSSRLCRFDNLRPYLEGKFAPECWAGHLLQQSYLSRLQGIVKSHSWGP